MRWSWLDVSEVAHARWTVGAPRPGDAPVVKCDHCGERLIIPEGLRYIDARSEVDLDRLMLERHPLCGVPGTDLGRCVPNCNLRRLPRVARYDTTH